MKEFSQLYKEVRTLENYLDTDIMGDHECEIAFETSCLGCACDSLPDWMYPGAPCGITEFNAEEALLQRYMIDISSE